MRYIISQSQQWSLGGWCRVLCRHNESGDDDDGSLCVCAASYRSAVSIMRLVLVLYWQHALLARLPADCSRQVDINETDRKHHDCFPAKVWSLVEGGGDSPSSCSCTFSRRLVVPERPVCSYAPSRIRTEVYPPPAPPSHTEIHPTLNNCNRRPRLQ